MTQTALFDELLDACQKEGCPVCRVEHAADLRYLERLFYELVNDYNTRLLVRASQGFCNEHAQMALDEIQGKALGVAIIYDDLMRIALEQIDKHNKLLAPEKKCPACENRSEINSWLLAEVSKQILAENLQSALQASDGLCFGHLRQALEQMRDSGKRNILINIQREIMVSLRAELAEYIRKNDYRFVGEQPGAERDAWIRAVRMVRK